MCLKAPKIKFEINNESFHFLCFLKNTRISQNIISSTISVDELRKLNAVSSCSNLAKQGIVRNQEMYIDADGTNFGEVPVKATCTFPQEELAFGSKKIGTVMLKICP